MIDILSRKKIEGYFMCVIGISRKILLLSVFIGIGFCSFSGMADEIQSSGGVEGGGDLSASVEESSKGVELGVSEQLSVSASQVALNPVVSDGGDRVWMEINAGSGFFLASAIAVSAFVFIPVYNRFGDKGLNIVSPFGLLAVGAATGAGVHFGGYMTDNIGSSWGAYVGGLAGSVVAILVESSGYFYRDRDYLWISRYVAYGLSPLLMVFGSVLGYELLHRSELGKLRSSESYSLSPMINIGQDYKSVGLSMKF